MLQKLKKTIHKDKKLYLILVIVIVCILGFLLFGNSTKFKIEPRLKSIKTEQKKDDDEFKTVGWIRVQGTKIDMPIIAIVNGEEFPLTREKYAWSVNPDDKVYNSMRIYGHNVYNLSATPKISSKNFKRFEEVLAFIYYDFAKENQYIQLSMNNKEYIYRIFSVAIINHYYMATLPTGENSKEDMKHQVKMYKDYSLYNYNLKVTEKDKLLSLVTCTRIYGRNNDVNIVVSAKQVNNYPIKKLSKIKKTDKYKELVEVMKGESKDEETTA